MNFRKISERVGVGGHFRSKKFRCNFFALEKAILVMNFRKKLRKGGGVISDLKNFIENLWLVQPICIKKRQLFTEKGAGVKGCSEFVWKFIRSGEQRLPEGGMVYFSGNAHLK